MSQLPEVVEAWERMETDASKLGGDDARLIHQKVKAIKDQAKGGKKKLVTVSAIRNSNDDEARQFRHPTIEPNIERSSSFGFNTTDHLNAVVAALENGDQGLAMELVQCVIEFTIDAVRANVKVDDRTDMEALEALIKGYGEQLETIISEFDPSNGSDRTFDCGRDQLVYAGGKLHSVTGVGEGMARDIYRLYFEQRFGNKVTNTKVESEDLLAELEFVDGENQLKILAPRADRHRREVEAQIIDKLSGRVTAAVSENNVVFAGGYSPVLAYNTGFSELVAAVVAGAATDAGQETSFTVEKAFPLSSADPRILEKYGLKPKPLKNVNPSFALNLMHEIMANTGVIESSGMKWALHKDVDVFVKAQDGKMSRIHDFEAEPGTVENLSLRSTSHVQIDVGSFPLLDPTKVDRALDLWARRLKYNPIVRHSSAGVVSMDVLGKISPADLASLNQGLRQIFTAEMQAEVSNSERALFCLGNNMNVPGVLKRATAALKGIGFSVERLKQGDQQVMVFMVDKEKAELALAAVHKFCVDMTNEEYDERIRSGQTDESMAAPLVARWNELTSA